MTLDPDDAILIVKVEHDLGRQSVGTDNCLALRIARLHVRNESQIRRVVDLGVVGVMSGLAQSCEHFLPMLKWEQVAFARQDRQRGSLDRA
jgi:hypothetical protein